jgi:amino acid adenylation domain-containing protein
VPRLLHTWVTEQAEHRPDATALVAAGERLTYGDLERRSSQVARLLREAGCRAGERVALMIPQSPAAIVSVLGILKSGGIYVPIDLGNPAPRAAAMLAAVEPCCLLATSAARPLLADLSEANPWIRALPLGWLDGTPPPSGARFAEDDARTMPEAPIDAGTSPGDPAYILFTSGSTGTPKGVVVTHANVAHFITWALGYFGLGADDRLSGHPPLHFDLSVFDLFGGMAAGAELHIVPDDLKRAPHRLVEWMRAHALTQWFSVPSALGYLAQFDALRANDLPALRRVLWCGDVLPTPVLGYWMRRLPHVRFTNLYGPTEATIASSYHTVSAPPPDDAEPVPIGSACEGEELLVLDDALAPVPPGAHGDLYIRGVGLSPGYWKDEARTAAAFVYPPGRHDDAHRMYKTGDLASVGDDGLVRFLGRADSQIKSRGHRIELGEIEAALHASLDIAAGAVVALPTSRFEGALICCAYVPARGAEPTAASLRRFLAARLPAYMVPARWLAIDRMPTNANGKTDRGALRELFRHREEAEV